MGRPVAPACFSSCIPSQRDGQDVESYSLLHLCLFGSHVDMLKLLLEKGANLNATDLKVGGLGLHAFSVRGSGLQGSLCGPRRSLLDGPVWTGPPASLQTRGEGVCSFVARASGRARALYPDPPTPCPQKAAHRLAAPQPCSTAPHAQHATWGGATPQILCSGVLLPSKCNLGTGNTSNPVFQCSDIVKTAFWGWHHLKALFHVH